MSVECQNLSLNNRGQAVFTNLNFAVANGELAALYGPTGCGKTSLLLLLAGLLKPNSGKILLEGQELSAGSGTMRRSVGLGVVPGFSPLVAKLTLDENLLLQAQSLKVRPAKVRVQEVLALLQLQAYARTLTDDLPAVIVAKAGLALALLNGADTLLLDEPQDRLTSEEGARIWELLFALKHKGKCIIISTRDQKVAAACDKTLIFPAGKVVDNYEADAVARIGIKTAMA